VSQLRVPRLLAIGTVVALSTAVRTGAASVALSMGRVRPLVQLAVAASGRGPDADVASATLRDELLGLMRDATEAHWRELRRGIDEFDGLTRPDGAESSGPRRRHRVKR
jgi:hypothetical protein